MMPGWETRCVERKARLACERAAESFATGQDRCVLRSQADSLAKLFKMSGVKAASVQQRLDVAGQKCRLLVRKLRRACERRSGVFVKGYVAERENFFVPAHL